MTTATRKAKPTDSAPDCSNEKDTPPEQLHVLPGTVKQGDLMAFIYYGRVRHKHMNGGDVSLEVDGLAGAPSSFHVHGNALVASSCSADQVQREEKASKTRAAALLSTAFNKPFTVCFEKADGSERVLRGRLIAPEPLLGRSHVEDLDVLDKHNMRLVDHRTIRYLILDCVKYTVE